MPRASISWGYPEMLKQDVDRTRYVLLSIETVFSVKRERKRDWRTQHE
jgi:hypothetical protein